MTKTTAHETSLVLVAILSDWKFFYGQSIDNILTFRSNCNYGNTSSNHQCCPECAPAITREIASLFSERPGCGAITAGLCAIFEASSSCFTGYPTNSIATTTQFCKYFKENDWGNIQVHFGSYMGTLNGLISDATTVLSAPDVSC